jgi:hypothetical protein
MTNICLNCNKEITDKFCSNCSQATSTHRFSLSHFIQHDFIHGIFHLDKGFLYTIKELFTRPGHSIREYVRGKRVKHFNYFATIILLMTITYFLNKWSKIDFIELIEDKESVEGYTKVLEHYNKIAVFLHIPFVSLLSFIFFKKSKQNYTENLVLNLYMLCGIIIISFVPLIFMIFIVNKDFIMAVNVFTIFFIFLYITIFYYQYFSIMGLKKYDLIIRVIIISILYLLTKQITNNILNTIGLKYFN